MQVWVASIQHKHGTNFYAARSEKGLKKQLADFAREYWVGESVPGSFDGLSDEDVVSQYFEYMNQFGDRGEFLESAGEAIELEDE